jgi:hypothetical protein
VKAVDASNNVDSNYQGTVHLSGDDVNAFFDTNDYTFTADDAGMHVFNAAFQTAGNHYIRAMDAVFSTSLFWEQDVVVV